MENLEHIQRIRKVLDYIENNLQEDLRLETIAKVGLYSPFHFHRIFKVIVGETIQDFIIRKKVEKAALQLSKNKTKSLTEIYAEIGFNSHSTFTKVFKKHYGIPPTQFRKLAPEHFSKISQINGNNEQNTVIFEQYICTIQQIQKIMEHTKIEVKQMPEMNLASVLSIGMQNVEKAYEKVINWGISKKLFPGENVKMISVYHDSAKVTPHDKVRINACMLVELPIKREDDVFPETLPSGKYIVGSYFITLNEFEQAWNGLFLWMNEKGYQFRKSYPYEIYHTNYKEHPEGKMSVDFCIPII
ncbi:AraC family transcriptional regulator [Flavobacterium terrae]|uniref:Transcriptional regulator, AraC family n=1 Tax=Flavobacterium terrae TaxID=415425 RepID=A0A1M6HB54_9FLAO|nr:AraC family transcriptional regulator [Flavobacterium terrae]SHJ19441.1 transcriptional regulator, AraC family [Flavobacterium terrae]